MPALAEHGDFIRSSVRQTFDAHAALNPRFFTETVRTKALLQVDKGFRDETAITHLSATRADQIVGYATVKTMPGLSWVQDIFVAPSHRGTGVGDALLAEIVSQARADGRDFVAASVWHGNEASHRLFRRCGFKVRDSWFWRVLQRFFPSQRSTIYRIGSL